MVLPPRLRKHAALLNYLSRGKPSIVRAIVKEADKDIVNLLCECAHNVVNRNIPLSPSQKRGLRKHKNKLLILLDKSVSIKKKKKALQTGGFIGTLLAAVLPALIGAITAAAT